MIADRENMVSQLRRVSNDDLLNKRKKTRRTQRTAVIVAMLVGVCALLALVLGEPADAGLIMAVAAILVARSSELQARIWLMDLVLSDREQTD
ncbi:MAG: hypothetical protein ACP5HU_10410 [Phycisphaerae bacterium]